MAKKEHTFESICRDIKNRIFSPVYILMGDEPYFMDRITELLINSVLSENEKDFNQVILYGADTDGSTIVNAARRYPMMSEYQLVIVREAQVIRDIELVASYVKNPLHSTVLVINYKFKTLDRRKTLASVTEKNGVLFESKKVPEYKMPAFINTVFQERSINIDPKACQMLSDFLGNDLSRLVKEMDKLCILLPENASKRITPELVEKNIGISKEYNNFELIKALAAKDVLKANRIINYFEKNPKNNPIQVTLPVVFNYFSNLLICFYAKDKSENGIVSELGLRSSFLAKDFLIGLRNYSAMKVFNIISYIRNTDANSKGIDSNGISDSQLLKELIYKIIH